MKKKRKVWKIIGGVLLAIILLLAAAVAYLTIREYRPDPIEDIAPGKGNARLNAGDAFTILTYNTGYAGLSKDEDFFMDGGSKVEPESKKLVEDNLKGITSILKKQEADIYFLQEVDRDSKRSYHIDEQAYYEEELGLKGMFACNFKCD
ncbi:endonuclease, partial [Clostridium sp. SL.3.18]|nr:endonuclease [Clostridium sp. SL.3.18]